MPRETDPFWKHVSPLPNKMWICKFCGNQYAGSATRIKAHLAGVGGYGIHGCKIVDDGVRSEAQKALKGKGPVESSDGLEGNVQVSSYPHLISSSLTRDPRQPATMSNEDTWRESSFAAMPNLSSDAMSTVRASSSAFLPLHETNVPIQSLPPQNMSPRRDFSFWPLNLSYPSSGRDPTPGTLTDMARPLNAEQGEPSTEAPKVMPISKFTIC